MRKSYDLLTDTNPAVFLGTAGTLADAVELAATETRPVFVQQYLPNNVMGKSYSLAELKATLKK